MSDLVVISMHQKGFPSADFYRGEGEGLPNLWEDEPAPDAFFTLKRGDTLQAAFMKAKQKWPDAVIVFAPDEEDDPEALEA